MIDVLRRRLPDHFIFRGLFEITGDFRADVHSFFTGVCTIVAGGVFDGCRTNDNCFPTG